MENNTQVILKSMADLQNENIKFLVDMYQRGYRWTSVEVNALLNDIYEFSQSGYNQEQFYCLQPIVIVSRDGFWKIVDGQQRLTTIYLIYLYYINNEKLNANNIPFSINYKHKEKLENCLKDIKINKYTDKESLQDIKEKYSDDIDCYFVLCAYETICDYFNAVQDSLATDYIASDMLKVINLFMKVIWYEMDGCDESDEISMFTKINMGKIPLTNAELIKAFLLKSDDHELTAYQKRLALEWDRIENSLSDSEFWGFLVNDDKHTTRIDFVFEVMAQEINEKILIDDYSEYHIEKQYNQQYFSFHVFYNYIKILKKQNEVVYIEDIWGKVLEYYQMFRDWYEDLEFYHLIGYIINNQDKKYITKLLELSRKYRSTEKEKLANHKTNFKKELRKEIIHDLKDNLDIENPLDEKALCEAIKELNYSNNSNKPVIKKVLLLHNICTLGLLKDQKYAKFPFNDFKDNNIKWEIEHINAIADERPNDNYDRDDNECRVWLKNAKGIPNIETMQMSNGNSVIEEINRIIDNKLYLEKNEPGLGSFINVYERIIKEYDDSDETDHSIANLTLLDSGTNHSYKNAVFPLKRQTIIEEFSKEIYIPVCTKNVFLKAYKNSVELLKWNKEDKEEYLQDIVEKITKYLKKEKEDEKQQ